MACEYLHEGKWYTEDQLRIVFQNFGSTTNPSRASTGTLNKIKEFLKRIDVDIQTVGKISYNGTTLRVNGIADPLNGLIQVVQGKEDIALTEEAMHMAVELIEQKNPKLFKEMMDRIGRYKLFERVMLEYQNNPFYQKEDKPDILKIKKEAIGKVLAQTAINKNEDANEKPELLVQTAGWWERIKEFLKWLFGKAQFNPFETAATQVLDNELEGSVRTGSGIFASRNPNVVNASLKLISSLRDPRAARWFNTLPRETFFSKLQQDLQAPKSQVDMLKTWMKDKDNYSVDDLITGIAAELSYAVEVEVSRGAVTAEIANMTVKEFEKMPEEEFREEVDNEFLNEYHLAKERDGKIYYVRVVDETKENRVHVVDPEVGTPSQDYSNLTVPGGTNYKENEIKTPGITPSIKGHAQFASDQGIGWFRSDDKVEGGKYYQGGILEGEMIASTTEGGIPTKTRRILEVQSDLFQKGRDKNNLTDRFDELYGSNLNEEEKGILIRWDDVPASKLKPEEVELRDRISAKAAIPLLNHPENRFLQLLNKENNWVTFFVKAIIQDSAKKGYENVRFPGGSTANKIEGQDTVEEFIRDKEDALEAINRRLDPNNSISKLYSEPGQRDDLLREKEQIERELTDARAGNHKFSAIASFYETTVQNILKKQGYKPENITDEHGNKWFEININTNRDLGEFYFQLSGPQDIAQKLTQRDINLTKREDQYEINGNVIKNNIQKEVASFYKGRLGAASADKLLKGFKQETEGKVQVDIKDILSRYIADDHFARVDPLKQTNPSAVDPNDNSFYMTLESHIEERIKGYEPGTLFFHDLNIYDGLKTAGTVDLLAITPEGKVDILQFKVPQASIFATDVPVYRQEAYNLEIENIRRILQTGYGINRTNFRFTRAIPIRATYENPIPGVTHAILSKLTVGNTNVNLIKDDLLLPISSESERSGDEGFDDYITRLRGLASKLASERVPPDKRSERTQRVAGIIAAIRKLQIKRDASSLVSSAKAIIKTQKEKGIKLKEKISNTDPNIATIDELNKIASDIMEAKDEVEIYVDMYSVFKNVFNDGTVESQDTIKEARNISDDAQDIVDDYWNMAVKFRTDKFSAKVGIKDEFTPEKKLNWYRRMIRSLSQSSTKAGAALWELVKRINNRFKLQFNDRLAELKDIEKRVDVWMQGKNIKELYAKIFQINPQGKWNGRVIQKISRDFYDDLKKAQLKRDLEWVKDNIDIDGYKAWFKEEHSRRLTDAKTARYHVDDAENARIIQQQLQEFVDNFHIDFKKGVGEYNWQLKNFPREDKWKSAQYLELGRSENAPLLDLYNYWNKRLKESWEEGMLHEHNGWSWFPNVRRNLLEKMSTAPAGGKLESLFGGIRIEAEDQAFGRIDPITGKPIDEVHANFVSDLGQWVQDADGNYFMDYGEKSMDIFKVIALWDAEIIKFKLKTESEDIARLLHYTEQQRKAYDSTATGRLRKTAEGKPIPISNEINAGYIKEHIDAVYYGKQLDDEQDITINILYKSSVEKINKLFGREILSVPEQEEIRISGKKIVQAMNRYFVTKTLGLNVMTSVAQLFGGRINAYINQGLYFNKKDLLEAELKYVSGRFYGTDQDKKLAGLIGYIHPFLEDRSNQAIRNLSVSGWVKHLSSDHLFFLQRGSDTWVNTMIGMAMLKNTMVHEGKIVNIRDFARKELGHSGKYEGTYEQTKEFDKNLEKRVLELQNSPQALVNYAQVIDDKMTIPGLSRDSDDVVNLRQSILETIKDALGNTSHEDLSLYKRTLLWQSFFMFKNWIPRMADVRFGSLKHSPGTQKYEYGRVRMLWNAVFSKNRASISSLIKLLGNNSEGLIDTAKKEYTRKREAFGEELQDLEMTEAEFVEMYIKGVRSEMKELMLAASLMGLLIFMRASAPDVENDPETKGAYRWALRGLDKLTDELAFMYTPSSFTSILNSSVFPAVNVLVDMQKFFTTAIEKLYYHAIGEHEKAEEKKVSKHLFRMLPITKEVMQYIAIFNADMAKEYGIRMNAQYGSVR